MAMLARIDILLAKSSISKATFYSDVGITGGALSQWKAGATTPRAKSIAKIADYLGVTVDELTGDTTQKTATSEGDGLDEGARYLLQRYKDAKTDEERKRIITAVEIAVNLDKSTKDE